MSRRIAYVFALAACATFVAPAGADPECFENSCRMPEVIEAPEAPASAPDETAVADVVPPSPTPAPAPAPRLAPEPIRPQMIVDELTRPALRPSPYRPVHQMPDKPVRQIAGPAPRHSDAPSELVEVVNRRYSPEQQQAYAANPLPSQPSAGVVVVVPGLQYGEDGVALLQGRQDASWELCQSDRRGKGRCGPYNYQPYGANGYRPLGVYRSYRTSPAYVYVPDAKILTIEGND